MKKQTKIHIAEPCSEDWSKMQPNEKGRFCQSCEKTVVDFSKYTTLEVHNYLKNHAPNSVCGHVPKEILDQVIIAYPHLKNEKSSTIRRFVYACMVLFGPALFSFTCEQQKEEITLVSLIEENKQIEQTFDKIIEDTLIELQNNVDLFEVKETTEKPEDKLEIITLKKGELEIVEPIEKDSVTCFPETVIEAEQRMIDGMMIAGGMSYISETIIETPQEIIKEDEILLYPNPAIDFVTVEFNFVDSTIQQTSLFVYDANGRQLLTKTIRESNTTQIDVSNLKTGTYHVVLIGNKSKLASKLVKR